MTIDHRSHSSSEINSPQLKICKCLSNKPFDGSALQPFNRSEADTRYEFLHIAYAAGQGGRPTMFELLIVISWSSPSPNSWTVRSLVGLCSGKKLRDIPTHDICPDIGPFRYQILYTIKWCETTAHFLGCDKTIAWSS